MARALSITLGLIWIHLAHFLEQIFGVRSRYIGRTRPVAIALFRTPRRGLDRLLSALRHDQKFKGKPDKGKLTRPCQKKLQMAKSRAMKLLTAYVCALFLACWLSAPVSAQTFARSPAPASSDAAKFEAILKKIDEQNAKIDTLSQQILKLEQHLSNARPGVMIGEGAAATPTISPSTQPAASPPANGNSHVVARGETLTSIAKMHKTTADELQKFNHIENPLKLQIGQTIMIPGSPAPASSPSSPGG